MFSKVPITYYIFLFCFIFSIIKVEAQCDSTFILSLDGGGGNYTGSCIEVYSEDTLVLFASLEDSLEISLLSPNGEMLSRHKFKPNDYGPYNITSISLDSHKNIIGTGKGSRCFIFKYDILTSSFLWFKFIDDVKDFVSRDLTEIKPGGDYLLSIASQSPGDQFLFAIDANNGDIKNQLSKKYNLGSADDLSKFIHLGNYSIGIGRFTNGTHFSDMRTTLMKFDNNNGTIQWTKLLHRPPNVSARLYGIDVATDGHQMNLNDNNFYLYRMDGDGSLMKIVRYDIVDTKAEWGVSLTSIPSKDGFILYSYDNNNSHHLFFLSIDLEGRLNWAKKVVLEQGVNQESFYTYADRAVCIGNYLYFTMLKNLSGRKGLVLGKLNLNGKGRCEWIEPLGVNVSDVSQPNVTNISVTTETFPLKTYTELISNVTSSLGLKRRVCIDTQALELGPDKNLVCNQDSLELGTNHSFLEYHWSTGDTTATISVIEPGYYVLTALDVCGQYKDSVFVGEIVPNHYIELHDTLIINAQNIEITPLVSGYWTQIHWYNGQGEPVSSGLKFKAYIAGNTFYYAELIDENGCVAIDTMWVNFEYRDCSNSFFVPNVFSPNNDGINDYFTIYGKAECVRLIKRLSVFDRWGEVVFEANNFEPGVESMGWDGYIRKKKDMNPGVFVYWAELEFYDGHIEFLKGDVTLVK